MVTMDYHSIASPIYTYRLHLFYFIKPFILEATSYLICILLNPETVSD
jgi:hypothetical protein